ncbi:cation:proton antiporter [Geodermatophilus sp. URMC 62]|uniref:cation:proton antiporter n=1 Tax=Geodermatophilus sp. URMC 62 TaxID=3423414 RepID=UPI00406BE861
MHGVGEAAAANVRTLLAVAVVIAGVRLVGWLVARMGQPQVMGEIVAGIVLGPSVLGLVWPDAVGYLFSASVIDALRVLAQLGLVLFMFLVGTELDHAALRGQRLRVAVIAQASVVVPVAMAVPLALWLYPRLGDGGDLLGFCLFVAAAMAVTAFPVLARLLRDTGLARSRVGVLSLVCAALNDMVAWFLLAVVVAVLRADGPGEVTNTLVLTTGFVTVMLGVVRPLLVRLPSPPLWCALLVAILSAAVTEQIGTHAILGAFVAGVVMPRREEWRESLHGRLDGVVSVVLLPIFFAVVGLSTRIDELTGYHLALAGVVVAVAIAGKFGGSSLAARCAGERWPEAITIGVLMNTRGLTEVVLLTIGLQLGVITSTFFTIMVLMALITTLMAAPVLRLIGARPGERADVPMLVQEPGPVGETRGVR